ncbi:MAG: ABC transporter substrate-binding protein, partial [Chromatiales bacterium]
NMQDAATSDPRVRRAIAHGIDRAAIIRFVLQRSARPAEALFPPEHWAGNPELTAIPYDPAQARALLAEAGYGPQRPLRLVYKTSSDPFRIRLATVIQSQLEAVGIEVELRSYDWGTFFGDIKAGRFQLYSLTWVGLRTPDSFRYIFGSDSLPPNGANRGRYVSGEVDSLLDRADAEQSLQERAASYRQIQQILHRDLPYVPLWYEDQLAASRLEITGYSLQADGNYDGLNQVRFADPRVSVRELAHVAN